MTLNRRPTSRDVAARAGVSVATVSYVVNGREGRVGAETRQRVLKAATELGYAPNASARGLKRQRTDRVCLVVSSIGVPATDQLSRDLHTAADEADHGVFTMVVNSESRAEKAFDLLQMRIADGVLVATPHFKEYELAALARGGLPLVVFQNEVEPHGFDVVRTPERESCAEAFDHLFDSGRKRVAFVAHSGELADPSGRIVAYREALAGRGIRFDERLLVTGANGRVSGYQAASELLELEERPDAIFAASDRAAISAIWAVRDAGLRVPEDVAVVGVGNLDDGLITRPQLSTVGPPHLDYNDVSRLLFDRIAEPGKEPVEHVLPWRFIQRGSA